MDELTRFLKNHRECAEGICPSSVLYPHILPSGEIMQKLLQLVWSLWEDPIDVRCNGQLGVACLRAPLRVATCMPLCSVCRVSVTSAETCLRMRSRFISSFNILVLKEQGTCEHVQEEGGSWL